MKSSTGRYVRRVDLLGPILFGAQISQDALAPRSPGVFDATLTPEGYLRIEGCISGTGVYEYSDASGEVWGELRTPEEVFAPEALESFALKPITDDHPAEMVTSANIKDVQCGQLGSNIRPDGNYVRADLLITDPALIAKIKLGKCQLSCGYEVIAIPVEGTLDGKSYRYKQTKIRGNHLSVVDEARGGPGCRLLLDSAGAFSSFKPTKDSNVKVKDGKFVIAGEEIDLPDNVVEHLKMLEAKVEEQGAELSKLSAEGDELEPELEPAKVEIEIEAPEELELEPMSASKDALQAQVDALRAQVKALQDGESAKINARVNLVTTAKKILGDSKKFDGHSDMAIMKAVVAKVLPSMGLKVKDSKSLDYVRAAYDAALTQDSTHIDSSKDLLELVGHATLNADSDKLPDLDKLYSSYCDSLKTRVSQKEAN
jgi:hypothetical protein